MGKSYDIGIITGWTRHGGSTESYINLTNALNNSGISTILLGPHDYHLDKCTSGKLLKLTDDVLSIDFNNIIWHFTPYPKQQINKLWDCNHILSCHETQFNPVFHRYTNEILNGVFDKIHFVSEHQRNWQLNNSPITTHNIETCIIPNIIDPMIKLQSGVSGKVGGVIGSIDRNKNVHVSIQQAIHDGCTEVLVFGVISDRNYFSDMRVIFDDPRVKYMGFVDNKSDMYSQITDVYHYSLSETWGYIKMECQQLGIEFHSNDVEPLVEYTTDEIIKMWVDILI